jgi:glyoxylase-like metal-dependent hydrolase (beta-lactamase superfamily II)
MGLYIRQLKLGPMENFVYLLGAEGAKETAIVDGAWDVPEALRVLERDGRELTHALVSHHHQDHTNGLPDLLAHGGVRVYVHANDLPELLPEIRSEVRAVKGGDAVEVGPLRILALHTPGHTPGSTCWQIEGDQGGVFSGDTVFVNACGRCDLRGGDPEQMFESLRRISRLDPDTRLYPGHDYGDVPVSSVAREKEKNPYFGLLGSLPEFVAYRMRPRR